MASFQKLGKNNWQYRISYKDKDGKYREKSKSGFRTKGDAEREANKKETNLKAGYSTDGMNGSVPLPDYLLTWHDTFRAPTISPVTIKRNHFYIQTFNKYCSKISIEDITRGYYQQVITKIGRDYAKDSVRKIHALCKACFRHAEYEGHVLKNPIFEIKITGKPSKPEVEKYLDYEDAQKLSVELWKNYTVQSATRGMCLVGLNTGMRIGEVMALTHKDIDFTTNTISVNKAWDYTQTNNFIPPKTEESTREIAVSDEIMKLLKDRISYNKKRILKLGVRPEHTFVFCNLKLNPVSHRAVTTMLDKTCESAGVKRITFHGLRHTHASILLHKNIPVEYISKRLGHSTISMTLDTYSHVLEETSKEQDKQVAKIMQSL